MLRPSIYDKDPVIQRLLRIRKLIDTPEKWTKGHAMSDDGAARCLMQAMMSGRGRWTDLTKFIKRNAGFATIPSFNDAPGTTHRVMLNMFDSYVRYCRRKVMRAQRKRVPAGMAQIHELVREVESRPVVRKQNEMAD